jgi:hypothetical protein
MLKKDGFDPIIATVEDEKCSNLNIHDGTEILLQDPPFRIRVTMKQCPHPDFQGRQIELDGTQPWSHLEYLLMEAGLEDFFCSIGNDQCNNTNIKNGATIMFSFSQHGGAKYGDWEVDALTNFRSKDASLTQLVYKPLKSFSRGLFLPNGPRR